MSVELNIAVAEAVFGAEWDEIPKRRRLDPNGIAAKLSIPSGAVAHRYGDGQVARFFDYLDLSGNMTDAMLVVKALRPKWTFQIGDYQTDWTVRIWPTLQDDGETNLYRRVGLRRVGHADLAVAICLAALEAIGHPVETVSGGTK